MIKKLLSVLFMRIIPPALGLLVWTVSVPGQSPCTAANQANVTLMRADALFDRDRSGRRILSVIFSHSYDLSLPVATPLNPNAVVQANLNLNRLTFATRAGSQSFTFTSTAVIRLRTP